MHLVSSHKKAYTCLPFCTANAYSTPSFHIHSRNFLFWNPTQPLSLPLPLSSVYFFPPPLLFFLGLFPIELCSIVSLKSMRKNVIGVKLLKNEYSKELLKFQKGTLSQVV